MKYKYEIFIYNDYLIFYNRCDAKEFKFSNFKSLYDFIKRNRFDYGRIRLLGITWFDLFDWFVDEDSILDKEDLSKKRIKHFI